jgi:transposase
LCPCDNASGHHQGKTAISGRGRPELRLAAWRAVWAAMLTNSVLQGRFTHLTTRQDNKLAAQQARVACAAALLRWLHVVVTRRVPWNPTIAAGEATSTPRTRAA